MPAYGITWCADCDRYVGAWAPSEAWTEHEASAEHIDGWYRRTFADDLAMRWRRIQSLLVVARQIGWSTLDGDRIVLFTGVMQRAGVW